MFPWSDSILALSLSNCSTFMRCFRVKIYWCSDSISAKADYLYRSFSSMVLAKFSSDYCYLRICSFSWLFRATFTRLIYSLRWTSSGSSTCVDTSLLLASCCAILKTSVFLMCSLTASLRLLTASLASMAWNSLKRF